MEKIIPLISSGTAGPLGLLHLPRLWQKGLLGAVGRLADEYQDIGPGYDHMVLEAIGIEPAKAKAFIREKKPTYFEFEAWVKAYPNVKLDTDTIAQSNAAVMRYHHTDAIRTSILKAAHIFEHDAIRDAVNLNNFDDWTAFHRQISL